jgi:hypothetical protein
MVIFCTQLQILIVFRDNAKFGVSFAGMDQGFSLSDVIGNAADATKVQKLNIRSFNLTTDICLPVPEATNNEYLLPIYILIGLSLLTCVIEVYTSRIRSRICNFVYPERAKDRAAFLHRTLKSGRIARHNELRRSIYENIIYTSIKK